MLFIIPSDLNLIYLEINMIYTIAAQYIEFQSSMPPQAVKNDFLDA